MLNRIMLTVIYRFIAGRTLVTIDPYLRDIAQKLLMSSH
jgi:hypothetical protein